MAPGKLRVSGVTTVDIYYLCAVRFYYGSAAGRCLPLYPGVQDIVIILTWQVP